MAYIKTRNGLGEFPKELRSCVRRSCHEKIKFVIEKSGYNVFVARPSAARKKLTPATAIVIPAVRPEEELYTTLLFSFMLGILYLCNLIKDPVSSEILKFLILRGPSTAYRIAKELNLHFAQAYRKVRRMESLGLVRREKNHRGDVVEVTPRGLIVCYYYSCVRHEVLLEKLAKLYQVKREDLAAFLDSYLETFKNDILIDDLPVMVYYAIYKGMPHSVIAPLLPLALKVFQLVKII